MAVSVTGNIHLTASASDSRTAITGAKKETGTRSMAIDAAWQIASGTAASQSDKVWADQRTVTTGATDSIDLAGTLTDAFGETVTFVKVRAILIAASTANTTTLQLARGASTPAPLFAANGDALAPLSAGGFFCWIDPAAGFAVGSAASDIFTVINSAGSPSAIYDIVVVGTSA